MPSRRRKPPRPGALTDLPARKILRSIILLQLSYYLIAALLISFTASVAGQPPSVSLVFDWRIIRGDNTLGWLLGLVWLCVALFAVIILLFLIHRSKLVLDFTLTLHFIHLVTTSIYTRTVPSNFLWWGLQTASSMIMVGLGGWACRSRELKPISFGLGGGGRDGSHQGGGGGGGGAEEADGRRRNVQMEDTEDVGPSHQRSRRGGARGGMVLSSGNDGENVPRDGERFENSHSNGDIRNGDVSRGDVDNSEDQTQEIMRNGRPGRQKRESDTTRTSFEMAVLNAKSETSVHDEV